MSMKKKFLTNMKTGLVHQVFEKLKKIQHGPSTNLKMQKWNQKNMK